MIKTEHFSIGFEYPRTKSNHGQIYLNGECFANTWQQTGDWRKDGKVKWTINKDGKAFELDYQHSDKQEENYFDTPEEMLNHLEKWLTNKNKNSIL